MIWISGVVAILLLIYYFYILMKEMNNNECRYHHTISCIFNCTCYFSIPLSTYMAKVMNGEHVFLSKILSPIENLIYKIIGVKKMKK